MKLMVQPKSGATNDLEDLERVRLFIKGAIRDGWHIAPTHKTMTVDEAATLTRDGFVIMARMKENNPALGFKFRFDAEIMIWGSDGNALAVPAVYDFSTLNALMRHCHFCDAQDIDTFRVGFADRACSECLPSTRKSIEIPGWNN
jgi:hypothetical protein